MASQGQHIFSLEQRTLFAVTWNVTVNDPGDLYPAYHAKLISFAQAAGNDWARLLNPSNVSIELQINIVTNISTAAAASMTSVVAGQNGELNLLEQGVTNEIRTGVDPNGASPDAILNINGSYMVNELYFDPASNPASRTGTVPGNKTDAYGSILHEFGHILAWNGLRDYTTGALPGNDESTFDQFVVPFGDDFYFNGPTAQEAYGGSVPLTYGNLYHVGNEDPRPGADLIPQLMNGVAFLFGTKYDFSQLDLAVIRDVGLPVRNIAPTVTSQTFDYLTKPSVSWAFDAPVRWELSVADVALTKLDNNTAVAGLQLSYDRGSDVAKLTSTANDGVLPDGNYRATLSNALVRDLLGNQLDQSYSKDFFVFAGDANHDRLVDTADFNALAGNFGGSGRNFAQGDFNYDGTVSSTDFDILAGNYGKRLAPPPGPAPLAQAGAIFASTDANKTRENEVLSFA